MAAQAGAVVGAFLNNSRADKVVFAEKSIQVDLPQSDKGDSAGSSKGSSGGDTPITPKDFYWDQILFYLVSAILGLSFLDISVEFFRGSIIQCFTPNVTERDQVAYLNNYCYGSLPNSQYYLIFILISALVIIAPHYLWMSYFGAHFDFFFDLVKKLNRLRDTNTGEYSPYNFELVKKLEQKFSSSSSPWIFRLYKGKLVLQLVFSILVLLVNAFYFEEGDFNESFPCPSDINIVNSTVWPFDTQFYCVYNSLTLLYFLRNTALGLVSAAIVVIIFGLIWCHVRHSTELGASDIAAFCDVSCLPPEAYPFPSARKVFLKIFCCGKEERLLEKYQPKSEHQEDVIEYNPICCPCFIGFWNGLKQAFSPRIHTDLDFLVARLFYADSGHGQVFKDIQIQKELEDKISQDHELLYLLNIVHSHLLKKRIKMKIARLKKRLPPIKEEENSEWERFKDLKKYFYDSKFGGSNPEDQVYSFFKSKMGVTLKDWSHSPLRSVLLGFLQFAPQNKLALDVSFGNRIGHSLILARAFYHVVTIHFNKYYKNPKEICREENYQANFRTFTFQANIFSQNAHFVTQSEKLIVNLFNELGEDEVRKLDLIVIGPMTDRSKIVTTNLLIEKIHARDVYFSKDAILLAIRPLIIGAKSCTEHFIQYQPPESIFEDINGEVHEKLAASNVPIYSVTPKGTVKRIEQPQKYSCQRFSRSASLRRANTLRRMTSSYVPPEDTPLPCGLAIECNNVQCIYEFRVFRLVNPNEEQPPPVPPISNDFIEEEHSSSYSEEETQDKVSVGHLVSPLQSPSLPTLLTSQYNYTDNNIVCNGISASEPTLLDNNNITMLPDV